MRPIIITLLGIIYFVMGVAAIIMGLSEVLGWNTSLGPESNVEGIAGMIVGLITLLVGYGLLRGWSWMWYLALIIAVAYVISGIYYMIKGSWAPLFTTIVSLIVVYYLSRPRVKKFFLDND